MARKNSTISILMSLSDKFSEPMEKVSKSTHETERRMKSMQNTVRRFRQNAVSSFDNLVKSAGKAALAITGIGTALSVAGAKAFANQAMELAETQIKVETELEALLKNVPSIAKGGQAAVKTAKQELLDYASQLQKTGVIGDEVTVGLMQQLATFQLSVDSIKTLAGGGLDLLAQTQGLDATVESAVSVANLIGKTMSGSTGALSRYGIIFNESQKKILQTGTEMEKAATLAEILAQNVGGVNAALAETDAGRIKQAQNAMGDMYEEVGRKLLPLKAQFAEIGMSLLPAVQDTLLDLINSATPAIDRLSRYIKNNKTQVESTIRGVGETIKKVTVAIGKAIKFVVENADTIIPIVAGIGAVFASLSIIDKVLKVIQLLKGVQAALAIIGTVGLGPIAAVVLSIGLATAIIVAHWDEVKDAMERVANWAKEHVLPIFEKIGSVMSVLGTSRGVGNYTRNELGANALGTSYWGGGMSIVGEHGAELVDLPAGSKVYPADRTKQMIGGNTINVSVNIQGNAIGNKELFESMGDYLANQVQLALAAG